MRQYSLGFSPCPNDTFIFQALASGRVTGPGKPDVTLADVEELNSQAAAGNFDVIKVSVAAAAGVLDEYVLLRSGGAMGYGVGPILVAKSGCDLLALDGALVAIPGVQTTANLLFGLCCKDTGIAVDLKTMVFDEVMPAVVASEVAAGVVIHEGRFTYSEQDLVCLLDLGAWWEEYTGLPIPLGAIAVKRSLGATFASEMNEAIKQSVLAARQDPDRAWEFIKSHAQEMDDVVIREHINTFVTDYSLDVGDAGVEAVARLLREAGWTGEDVFVTS